MGTTILFHHIPKTAGTTVRKYFQSQMQDQLDFIHLTPKGDKIAKSLGLLPYKSRSLSERNKAKIIFGHDVSLETKNLITNSVKFAVTFRNPKDWLISRYNQKMNRLHKHGYSTYGFEYWLNSIEKTHSQFEWLIKKFLNTNIINKTEQLIKILDKFHYIYTSDQVPKIIKEFGKIFHVEYGVPRDKNVVGVHKINFFKPSQFEKELLEEVIEEDINIYKKIILPLVKK